MRGTLVILLATAVTPIVAQDTASQDAAAVETKASQIFNTVMSPFCPGRLLANCPSAAAHDLQDEIRKQLYEGTSVEDITAALYARYGDEIRTAPKATGFGLLAWIIPGAFFLVVGIALMVWIRKTTRGGEIVVEPTVRLDAESAKLLEEEMSRVEE